jgi:hypothetical protein
MEKILHRKKKKPKRQKRHTHSTAAGIEDALSIALDILLNQERGIGCGL